MGMQIIDVCCQYTHDTYSKKSCTNKRTHSLQLYKNCLLYTSIALQPLEVIVARPGLFHDGLAQRGKLGGQHKVPRLSNTREYIETMLALNSSPQI